jgi:hypothetical protein
VIQRLLGSKFRAAFSVFAYVDQSPVGMPGRMVFHLAVGGYLGEMANAFTRAEVRILSIG